MLSYFGFFRLHLIVQHAIYVPCAIIYVYSCYVVPKAEIFY